MVTNKKEIWLEGFSSRKKEKEEKEREEK